MLGLNFSKLRVLLIMYHINIKLLSPGLINETFFSFEYIDVFHCLRIRCGKEFSGICCLPGYKFLTHFVFFHLHWKTLKHASNKLIKSVTSLRTMTYICNILKMSIILFQIHESLHSIVVSENSFRVQPLLFSLLYSMELFLFFKLKNWIKYNYSFLPLTFLTAISSRNSSSSHSNWWLHFL